MADLISREAAKEEILSWAVRITSPNNLSTADTMYVLDMLPAADAVEVVRCRDCEWWNTEEVGMTGDRCRCERFSLVGYSENYTYPMDFCSYGDRR